MKKFKSMLREAVESSKEKDGPEYKAMFAKTLKKYGAESIDDLSDEEKKKFFAEIDKKWKSDSEGDDGKEGTSKGEKDESCDKKK